MPKSIKKGDLVTIKDEELNAKGFYHAKVESIDRRMRTATVRMPDGSVETVLISLLLEYVAPPLFEMVREVIRGLIFRVKRWANREL